MDDDPLEDAIVRALRTDEQGLDPRVERLVQGTLPPAERAALEADAASDPELAEILRLAAPLSASTTAQILGEVRREVRPMPRPRPRLWAAAAGLAAAAGALLLARVTAPPIAPLPHYQVEARVEDAAWRSADAARATTLRADSELAIVLRPELPVAGAVAAILWVVTPDGARRVHLAPERSADGAFRWVGTGRAITGLERGTVELVVVVARAALMNLEPDRARREGAGEGWQAAVLRVEVRPAGEGAPPDPGPPGGQPDPAGLP